MTFCLKPLYLLQLPVRWQSIFCLRQNSNSSSSAYLQSGILSQIFDLSKQFPSLHLNPEHNGGLIVFNCLPKDKLEISLAFLFK